MIKVLDYSAKDVIVKLPTKMVSKFFGFSNLSKSDIQKLEYDFPLPDEVKVINKFKKAQKKNFISLDTVLAKLK